MKNRSVEVPNISCGHCVKTIERELAELAGVGSVSADQAERSVHVEWDEEGTSWEEVEALLREIGYPPA